MRRSLAVAILVTLSALPVSLLAQQSAQTATAPTRDQQAVAVLQKAFAAMGNTLPRDSVATGTVTIVEGSHTETGSIYIATRGSDQSKEDIDIASGRRTVVFSRGLATETSGANTKASSFEWALTIQSYIYPVPLIAWALSAPEAAVTYIGLESLDGVEAHHLRLAKTFPNEAMLGPVVEFTIKDLWIGARTGLPLRLACVRRPAAGAVPRIPLVLDYSDFKLFNGILYPSLVRKTFNGTLWTTIQVTNVTVNTGLADTDFPISTQFALPGGRGQ